MTLTLTVTDQDLLQRAKATWGRKWQEKFTDALLRHTRAAVGLEADLTHEQAARELNISKRTLTRRRNDGAFPHSYLVNQRVIRYPVADIKRYKEQHQFIVT